MANLKTFTRIKRTSSLHGTTNACVAKVTAPSNRPVWVWVSIYGWDISNAESTRWALRTGTTGGTYDSTGVTGPNKQNEMETSTPQVTVQNCSVNANNDGVVVDSVIMGSGRSVSFQPVLVKGGGTLHIFAEDAATVANDYDVCIKTEE